MADRDVATGENKWYRKADLKLKLNNWQQP